MALPIIIGALAVGLVGTGAKKAYDGYQDKSLANDILDDAKKKYRDRKGAFDVINDKTSKSLESLGNLELTIGNDFAKFDKLIEEILQNNNFQKYGKTSINVSPHKLNKIKELAITATDYLKTVVGGGVTGAAAGFAVYGGVMALGAASTGTAISSLSGVAAYNATMAAIGGGSLAAGGWGMAGGAMVLGSAVVAPLVAIGGIAYARHAAKALENAREVRDQVEDAVSKLDLAENQLVQIRLYAMRIEDELQKMYKVFSTYLSHLININRIVKTGDAKQIMAISDEANICIQNGVSLAAIMAKLISTPLFKLKKDSSGKLLTNSNGIPEIETDKSGMQVMDEDGLNIALNESSTNFKNFNSI